MSDEQTTRTDTGGSEQGWPADRDSRDTRDTRDTRDDRGGGYRGDRGDDYRSRDRDDDRGDRDDRGGGRYRSRNRVYFRKKIDKIKAHNLVIDYKHPEVLRRFLTDQGKILPRRITGTSAKNQRRLVREVKRARAIALLPLG